ncbi:hypothetical protein Sjap_004195 [Stephania japonica]|uniref:Uncharacterized protein n=1 Tax=Stephania japonica TaxID=461633 RepID=A0AAP0PHM0_9MAGN
MGFLSEKGVLQLQSENGVSCHALPLSTQPEEHNSTVTVRKSSVKPITLVVLDHGRLTNGESQGCLSDGSIYGRGIQTRLFRRPIIWVDDFSSENSAQCSTHSLDSSMSDFESTANHLETERTDNIE